MLRPAAAGRASLFAIWAMLCVLAACSGDGSGGEQLVTANLDRVTPQQWAALSQRTVYFGHQSVGANVLDGVRAIAAQHRGIPLAISSGAHATTPGVLSEFAIGENGDPDSKNAAFLVAMRGTLGPRPVLMFKYCFVDIDDKTDAGALFQRYRKTVAALGSAHPEAVLVHVTIPLTTDSQLRNFINAVRGRPTRRTRNGVREAYNELLRAAYAGKEPIFDLARVQSTRADGTREHATVEGRPVYALAREWASDDGHLNVAGSRRAAEELLVTLAALPQRP